MVIVEVTGLPSSVKMPKLIFVFRAILKGAVNEFWIRELADTRGSDTKEASVELTSLDDAWKFQDIFDGHRFTDRQLYSVLSARIVSENYHRSPSPYHYRSRSSNRGWRDRARSRSPLHSETSKLDMELELLRKQRLVIEEERRLLVERKKLELIKEFGASASRELEEMEKSRDRKRRPVQPPTTRRESRPKPQTRPGTLPQFLKPCKVLIRNMKPIIEEKAEETEKKLLVDLIRSQLRKTLALLLENKDYMPSVLIIKLYRDKYPKSTDAEVVVKNLEQLRASHWPVTNQGNAKPQSKGGAAKKKINAKPQAKSEITGSPPTPVANVKQEPKEDIVKKEKVDEIKADSKVQEIDNIKNNIKVEEDTQVQQNITAKKDSKVQEDSLAQENSNIQQDTLAQENSNVQQDTLAQENSNVQQDTLAQENSNVQQDSSVPNCKIQQLLSAQMNSKTQEDNKVQEDSKIEVVPKVQIKSPHNEIISTVDTQMIEDDDDDWIENGLDWNSDENSQASSMNQE